MHMQMAYTCEWWTMKSNTNSIQLVNDTISTVGVDVIVDLPCFRWVLTQFN
jgi:hypothetical protein